MLQMNPKISFLTKILALLFVVFLVSITESFSRDGIKLYSVGNNVPWNSANSWSITSNGTGLGLIPQNNDTLVIITSVVQNVNFTLSGNGSLIVSHTGLLRGDNFDLTFAGNASFDCNGEVKTNNLILNGNSTMTIESNGKISVNGSLTDNSVTKISVTGQLVVLGTLYVGSSSNICGSGTIESAHFDGNGTIQNVAPVNTIANGSLLTENNWIGNIDNNWNEPLNWAKGTVPAENANVAILNSTNIPHVSGISGTSNLYVNSGATLTIDPLAILDVKGNLTIKGAGNLLLKNSVSEKSSLILEGDITGKIQTECPVLAGQKSLISSPVDMALSSTFLNMYLRTYDEASSQWGEYIVPTSDPLKVMQGYELYSLSNSTRIFEGTPNNNSKTFAISNSGNGLNLTGNPFPCYIDWENTNGAWQRNSIASAIYYPDPSGSGNYSVYLPGGDDAVSINNGNRYIAPMQGFFVKAGNQGSLTVNKNSRVRSVTDSKLILKNNSIKFKLTDDAGLSDEAILRVMANSTSGFDDELDAIKIQGSGNTSSLNFTSSVDDIKYAINTLPEINSAVNVPLNINCTKSGIFSITTAGCFKFDSNLPLILEDKELNKFIDLRTDSVYSFSHTPLMNPNRFEIHFYSTQGIAEQGNDSQTEVYVTSGEVKIKGKDNDVYTACLYTTDGKLINTAKGILSDGLSLTTANQPLGICVLQVYNGKHSITKKILTK